MNKRTRELMHAGARRNPKSSDCWRTPTDLFQSLNKVFNFTLDPCTAEDNHLGTSRYFTEATNGLGQSWVNQVAFVNPPYSDLKSWVGKCMHEMVEHGVTSVMLIPARTDTKVFQELAFMYARAICFMRGRVKFEDGTGQSRDSAPFPSALVVFAPRPVGIVAVNKLREFGFVVEL